MSVCCPRCRFFPPLLLLLPMLLILPVGGCASHRPPEETPEVESSPVPPPAAAPAEDEPAIQEWTGGISGAEAEGDLLILAPGVVLPQLEWSSDGDGEEPPEEVEPSPLDELATTTPEISPEEARRELDLAESQAPIYDIPMVLNDKVAGWLDYYSNRNPKDFLPGLVRSGRYLKMIREIFREEGLPLDLAYMAHVESAYKVRAYSRAHAKGVFQFIAGTARKYGLRIDYWVDERSDPEKSARAAAAYLSDLYGMFDDWYLALAAYNAGEGRIRRALARSREKDFWGIAKRRLIRRETRNYVPAILAATLISKDPKKYGFAFEPDPPVAYDTIRVEDAVDLRVLAKCAGSDLSTLRTLNPALRRHQTPPGRATDVRVPVGKGETTLAALEKIPKGERILYARHVVKRGDTLWEISRRYRVAISGIQQANGMGRRTLLRVGSVLKIPTAAAASYGGADSLAASGDPVIYRVRRGDTLTRIARRFGTTAGAIARSNGISIHKTLYPGERLRIGGGARAGGGSVVHVVRRGDTLWRIANRYQTSIRSICALNGINANATLYPGTRLTIRR